MGLLISVKRGWGRGDDEDGGRKTLVALGERKKLRNGGGGVGGKKMWMGVK